MKRKGAGSKRLTCESTFSCKYHHHGKAFCNSAEREPTRPTENFELDLLFTLERSGELVFVCVKCSRAIFEEKGSLCRLALGRSLLSEQPFVRKVLQVCGDPTSAASEKNFAFAGDKNH